MKAALVTAGAALVVLLALVGRFHTLYGTPNLFGDPESLSANDHHYTADGPRDINGEELFTRYPTMRESFRMRPLPGLDLGSKRVLAPYPKTACTVVLALQLDDSPARYRLYTMKGGC